VSENSVSHEIQVLEQKREALENLISVVNSLESMTKGLKASMEMGKSAEDLPLDLLKAYSSLGKKVRNSSDAEIKTRIESVDAIVKNKLKFILLLTQDKNWSFYEEESRKSHSPLFDEIDNFVRLTHTNIALRVLIEKRTGKTHPFENLVAESQIRKRVELIEKSEISGRKQIVRDVEAILKDVNSLLDLPGLTPSMKRHLTGVKDDLKSGLRHLITGKPIKDLPVDIGVMTLEPVDEVVEIDITEVVESDISETVEVDDERHAEVCPSAKSEQALKEEPCSDKVISEEAKIVKIKLNWWGRFLQWLNTPWGTSWKELKHSDKKKK